MFYKDTEAIHQEDTAFLNLCRLKNRLSVLVQAPTELRGEYKNPQLLSELSFWPCVRSREKISKNMEDLSYRSKEFNLIVSNRMIFLTMVAYIVKRILIIFFVIFFSFCSWTSKQKKFTGKENEKHIIYNK